MTDTTPEMPLRIWATVYGDWAEQPWRLLGPPVIESIQYIRADAEAGMRRNEAIAESERKAEAEVERLRALLRECAIGLEAEVEARYPAEARKYPSEERRYRRDIEPVIRARAALGEGETC